MTDRGTCRGWTASVVLAVTLATAGCSGSAVAPPKPVGPTAADGLANLRDLYRQAAAGTTTLPKSVAEFSTVEPFYPVAGPFVLSGDITCAWGAGLVQGDQAAKRLLAWETAAAKEGGWAMFQDGTIRKVSADEFKAAAKATP